MWTAKILFLNVKKKLIPRNPSYVLTAWCLSVTYNTNLFYGILETWKVRYIPVYVYVIFGFVLSRHYNYGLIIHCLSLCNTIFSLQVTTLLLFSSASINSLIFSTADLQGRKL